MAEFLSVLPKLCMGELFTEIGHRMLLQTRDTVRLVIVATGGGQVKTMSQLDVEIRSFVERAAGDGVVIGMGSNTAAGGHDAGLVAHTKGELIRFRKELQEWQTAVRAYVERRVPSQCCSISLSLRSFTFPSCLDYHNRG